MAPKKRKRKDETIDPTVVPYQLCSSKNPTFEQAVASVAKLLQGRKKIMVLAGAGISVSCGIPDFRSPQGLYANLDTHVRSFFKTLGPLLRES